MCTNSEIFERKTNRIAKYWTHVFISGVFYLKTIAHNRNGQATIIYIFL